MIGLNTPRMRLELDPGFGARIATLRDLGCGRDWLVPGPPLAGAVYGVDQARGWDECFPTVGPCPSARRDHGDLWGQPATVAATPDAVLAEWDLPGRRFRREIAVLADDCLEIRYRVENLSSEPFDWMWSQHCLIAPRPGDRLLLDGFDDFASGGRDFRWPRLDGRDLSVVPAPDAGWAVKAYARARGRVTAAIANATAGLVLAWDGADIPALGLWISHGGWHGATQIAIEPATAHADDLDHARLIGTACSLAPGAARDWSLTLRLSGPLP